MIWIVDASVAVKWFLKEEHNTHADAVLERWIGIDKIIPPL